MESKLLRKSRSVELRITPLIPDSGGWARASGIDTADFLRLIDTSEILNVRLIDLTTGSSPQPMVSFTPSDSFPPQPLPNPSPFQFQPPSLPPLLPSSRPPPIDSNSSWATTATTESSDVTSPASNEELWPLGFHPKPYPEGHQVVVVKGVPKEWSIESSDGGRCKVANVFKDRAVFDAILGCRVEP